jgi:hypothetical protein
MRTSTFIFLQGAMTCYHFRNVSKQSNKLVEVYRLGFSLTSTRIWLYDKGFSVDIRAIERRASRIGQMAKCKSKTDGACGNALTSWFFGQVQNISAGLCNFVLSSRMLASKQFMRYVVAGYSRISFFDRNLNEENLLVDPNYSNAIHKGRKKRYFSRGCRTSTFFFRC